MSIFTVAFSGTDCWANEGLIDRPDGSSTRALYGQTGYIPVQVKSELFDHLCAGLPGPGVPYMKFRPQLMLESTVLPSALLDMALGNSMWDLAGQAIAEIVGCNIDQRGPSDLSLLDDADLMALVTGLKTSIGVDLRPDAQKRPPSKQPYQFNTGGYALALKLAAVNYESGRIRAINLIGHSRGAVAAIICSQDLGYLFPDVPVNIFAIDPVPGALTELVPEIMTLGPTVTNYVGVYAVDEVSYGFNGILPATTHDRVPINPVDRVDQVGLQIDVPNYHLIYARGRHSTVAGNVSALGTNSLDNINPGPAYIGKLVNCLARACMSRWGTPIAAATDALQPLRDEIAAHTTDYRNMRSATYLTGPVKSNERERSISYVDEKGKPQSAYLEDLIGIQPLVPRTGNTVGNPGKIKWQAIQDIPNFVFDGDPAKPQIDTSFFTLASGGSSSSGGGSSGSSSSSS